MTFRQERGAIQENFPRELAGFPVFAGLTGAKSTELIRRGAIAIGTGQSSDVYNTKSDLVSLGANPCMTGVIIVGSNPVIIHTSGRMLTLEQQGILSSSTYTGIMGGGSKDTYRDLSDQLKEYGITIVQPPSFENTYFNCAVIRTHNAKLRIGIWIGYDYD